MAQPELDEPLIDFFKSANINAIHRVIERAQKAADRAHRKQMAGSKVSAKTGVFVKVMNKAMASYGRAAKNRPSIRQTAPDTGGRPYHFGYTTVTKGTSTRGRKGAASSQPGADGAGPSSGTGSSRTAEKKAGAKAKRTSSAGGSRRTANTPEAAHQVYTERDGAIEQDAPAIDPDIGLGPDPRRDRAQTHGLDAADGSGLYTDALSKGRESLPVVHEHDDGPELSPNSTRSRKKRPTEIEEEATRHFVEDAMAAAQGITERASAAAAQAYIEDPTKTPSLMGTTASFGTIGKTLEERMAFWDAVHEHESDKGGRTQTRVVLELPHEATSQDRHEIVRRYTDEFRRKGIPFWASIHAPTKDNDARNHHAHVVFTDRPMQQMPHPETGEIVWDFTIAEVYKSSSRNRITRYPYRQNRDPEMRDRGYVKVSRSRFATIVNEVMETSTNPVRYDPRSYKDMGLDVAPMRNVTRILADKLDKRRFVVMDAEWTRKMIDAEIQAATARRDTTFVALQASERDLQAATRNAAKARSANARLPKHLRLSPTQMLGKTAANAFTTKIIELERDRLATKFATEATLTALQHIVTATTPHKTGKGRGRAFDPASAPDPEDLATLHAAALDEIAALHTTSRAQRARFSAKHQTLKDRWNGWRNPDAPPPTEEPPPRRPSPPQFTPGFQPHEQVEPQPRRSPPTFQQASEPFFEPASPARPQASASPQLTGTIPLTLDEILQRQPEQKPYQPPARAQLFVNGVFTPPAGSPMARMHALIQQRLNPLLDRIRNDPTWTPDDDITPPLTPPAPTPTAAQTTTPARPRTPDFPAPVMGPVHRTSSITNPIPTATQPEAITPSLLPTKHEFRARYPTAPIVITGGPAGDAAARPPTQRNRQPINDPETPPPIAFTRNIPDRDPPRPTPPPSPPRTSGRASLPAPIVDRPALTAPVNPAPSRSASAPTNSPGATQPISPLAGQGPRQDSPALGPDQHTPRPTPSPGAAAPAATATPTSPAPSSNAPPDNAGPTDRDIKEKRARKRRKALRAKRAREPEL